jgi:hypothetical protein
VQSAMPEPAPFPPPPALRFEHVSFAFKNWYQVYGHKGKGQPAT